MNTEMFNALVELVKQGGWMAILGIFMWCVLGIVKVSIVGGFVCVVFSRICSIVRHWLDSRLLASSRNYSLVSKETSDTLLRYLEQLEATHKETMTHLQEQYQDLKTSLKSTCSTKKTKP
jgi:hypothetical protein